MSAKKTWTLKNDGTVPWPNDTNFMCIYQDKLLKVDGINEKTKVIEIKTGIMPNMMRVIAVYFNAPKEYGKFGAEFQLVHGPDNIPLIKSEKLKIEIEVIT